MEMLNYEDMNDLGEEGTVEEGGVDSSEEAFMRGYNDESDAIECAECGAIAGEDKVEKEINGEKQVFCTELCAKEFEESAATD